MKISLLPAMLLAAAATLSLAAAEEKPFSFTIEGDTLHIFAPDGKEIGTGLAPATVAQPVSAPPYSFQVSFGADANGNLAVIVAPDPEHPTPLSFTLANQAVQMEPGSIATVTLGQNGAATVTPGLTGGVKVDGHVAAAAPSVVASAPASSLPAAPATVSAQQPGATAPADNNPGPDTAPAPQNTNGSFNANPVAAIVANNPQVASDANVAVPNGAQVVQTAGGLGVSNPANPGVVISLPPQGTPGTVPISSGSFSPPTNPPPTTPI